MRRFPRRRLFPALLLLFGLASGWAAPATTHSSQTFGPFTWTSACGQQMQVTVTVSQGVPQYPGLYLWNYDVENISMEWSATTDDYQMGVSALGVYFPQEVPEIANFSYSGAWGGGGATPEGIGINTAIWFAGVGNPVAGLMPGQSASFSFTTNPRGIAKLSPCQVNSNGNFVEQSCADAQEAGYSASLLPAPGRPGRGGGVCELAALPSMTDGGSGVRLSGALLAAAQRGRRRPMGDTQCGTQGDGNATGQIVAPGPAATLKSFSWKAVQDPSNQVGMEKMWEDNQSEWWNDALTDEGRVEITDPQWVANDDGTVKRSDPVAYTSQARPALTTVVLKISATIPTSGVLRVSSDSSLLAFPDTSVQFENGQAVVGKILANTPLPTEIQNVDLTLTWSLSLDGGQTFVDFASTEHTMFVTLGLASGFDGFLSVPAAKNVTAARVDFVTSYLKGQTTPTGATGATKSAVMRAFTFGEGSVDKTNPWQPIQNPPSMGFDCISLSILAVVQLRQAGVDASPSLAWATPNGNASEQHAMPWPVWNGVRWVPGDLDLEYYSDDGTDLYLFEGFLYLRDADGTPVEAHTLAPNAGPLAPQAAGSVPYLPADPVSRLAFRVIYNTLLSIRMSPGCRGKGGQQWWIDAALAAVQGPVALPTLVPLGCNNQ